MIFLTMREQLFVEITKKQDFRPYKHDKCRICLIDKFSIYHGRGRRLRKVGGTSTPQRALNCLTHKEHKKT